MAALAGGALHAAADAAPDRPAEVAVSVSAAVVDLDLATDDAAFLLAAGRAREADARLTEALAAAPGATPASRIRAQTLQAEARRREAANQSVIAADERAASAASARMKTADLVVAAGGARAERLARINDLRQREHRELALAHCRALLHDLPGDEEIDGLYRDLLDETHAARKTDIKQRQSELRSEIALMMEKSLLPEGLDGMPMFPSDWGEERSGRRSPLANSERAEAWEEALTDRLAGRATLQLDAVPLAEALAMVGKLGGLNLVVAPDLLAAGDRLVTLRAVEMRLDSILSWMAEQASTTWGLASGGIYVGEQPASSRTIVLHDLGELLVGVGDFPGLQLAMNAGDAGGGGGFLAPTESDTPVPTADDIAELIKRSISPATWTDADNSMIVRGNTLLVTAPPAIHRLIGEFLRSQSAQHSLMVRVELRWLELTDTYAEEIGVQWFSGTNTYMNGIPGNATSTSGLLRQVNGWAVEGGSVNQLPSNSMSIQATGAPGMTMQAAFLGSTQLSAVLSASERNHQGRALRAPELACMNGQRANAFFGNQVAYISDYEIVAGQYDPVITVLNIGSSIDVRPLVSADRRYVTMELQAATATVTFSTEVIQAAYLPPGDVDLEPGFEPPVVGFPLELPNVEVREVGTSVMLPDRGSLLVGGFTAGLDQFAATRVPLLGSIPFLGRLFGARGRYAEKRKLNLVTTVTIINYPELEARL